MNKKHTLLLFSLAGLALVVTIWNKHRNGLMEQSTPITSGAFESLSLFGQARTYPFDKLPEAGYIAAWQQAQRMERATSRRATDPWETMGPHNRAGRMLKIAFNPLNPNTMYAGSASGGLWRSYTGGVGNNAWHKVPTGFPVLSVSSIAFLPHDSLHFFIGTGEVYNHQAAGTGAAYRNTRGSYGMGILRTADGGATWEKSLDFTYDQNKGVWDIDVSKTAPDLVYAATTDGVYRSKDGGENWQLVLDVVQATDVLIHPEDPTLVLAAFGNFSSPGYGIYRSTDGGDQWVKITDGLPSTFKGKIGLDFAPSNPAIVYASIGNGFSSSDGASWLCRSDNFGENWEIKTTTDYSIHQGWYSHDVAVNPTDPDEVVAIGIDVWKSTNGGANLQQKSQSTNGGIGFVNPPIEGPDGGPEFVHSDCHDVIYHPSLPNVFYIADDGGIHRSTDGGGSFHSCSGRLQTAQFYNGFSNSATDANFCMGGLQDNGTIRLNEAIDPATGLRVTWRRLFGGDGSWTGINQQNDFRSYISWQTLNVLRTTDGTSYNNANIPKQNPTSFIAPFVLAPSNGNIVYAGSSTVAKTTNNGGNWTTTNGGAPLDGHPVLSMSVAHQDPDIVFAATAPYNGDRSHVFVTLDGGDEWQDVTGNLPDRFPMDLEFDPTNDSVAYLAFSGYGSGHVFRTTDLGATWEDISANLPDIPANAIAVDPLFPTNIYVGNDLGVFSSVDDGATWQSYQEGLTDGAMVFDLKISPANRKLRAATHGSGVYQRDLLETPFVSATNTARLAKIALAVHPNPASQQAKLRFYLPEKQLVTIELMDISGQKLKTVLWETLAEGNHEIALPIGELRGGTYYCVVKSATSAGTGRLVVLRK